MRRLLIPRTGRPRTAPARPAPAPVRRDRAGSSGAADTAIVSGTALAITGVAVYCHWSPEQLALVLTATAGCTAPALLRGRS
ncbi:hypothetical protein AB0O91_36775 [Kitasatospora sp. NPDC089797]|uniref:hypothetical protein n=1 Tax=Kitasatospora sp. NPDC089797 TaxID=3155298 RepID=UPI00342BCABF